MVERVTVAISRETADRLRKLGRYGDTMDSIIHRLLDEYEKIGKESDTMLPVVMTLSLPMMIRGICPLLLTILPL